MTSMFDGWSPNLDDLIARRFLLMHRNGRRCQSCTGDGRCRHLAWAVNYFRRPGEPVPGQAALILARALHTVSAAELRRIADELAARLA